MDDLADYYRSRLFDRKFPVSDLGPDPQEGQQGFGELKAIPRNTVEQLIGNIGAALEHAGVPLEQIGVDIPALGRVTAKDLLLGDSADFLNSLADGFYPVAGEGETARLSSDATGALDIAAIPGVVTGTAKLAAKGAKAAVTSVAKSVPAVAGAVGGWHATDSLAGAASEYVGKAGK